MHAWEYYNSYSVWLVEVAAAFIKAYTMVTARVIKLDMCIQLALQHVTWKDWK